MFNSSKTYKESVSRIASEIPVSDKNILITGATGLIGSFMVDAFAAANDLYSKNISIYAMGRSLDKLEKRFGDSENIHLVAQNVMDPITIDGLDYIVHAASNADPRSYALYPYETILTNVIGAKNVLEYCKGKTTRALLTSTFEVNGKLDQDVYSENEYGTVDLNLIRSSYTESKRDSEMLFKAAHDEYAVDCLIARLSSIYGPTMLDNDSKAHAQFIRNALKGEAIVLKSKGTQKRTYCYVSDAVSGLLKVLFDGASGEIYNVANDQSIATIAEVANALAELTDTKVVFDLPDAIESKGFSKPQNCILNIDKLKALGWSGKYDLKTGLEETLTVLREMGK